MSKITEKIFAQRRMLELNLLDTMLSRLSSIIQQKGYASMLLSGGKSPVSFYHLLAHTQLSWEKVYLGLSDERWVPPDHPDSNEKCIRDSLLRGNAQIAQFIGFKTTHDNVLVSANESEKQLKNLPRPFNIILLGMGEDGHIASLFPDSPDLKAALNPDCKILSINLQTLRHVSV